VCHFPVGCTVRKSNESRCVSPVFFVCWITIFGGLVKPLNDEESAMKKVNDRVRELMLKGAEQRFDELVAKDDLHVGHYSPSRVQRCSKPR
jgi:hypothetical protein